MARLDRAAWVPKPPESAGGVVSLNAYTGQVWFRNLSEGFHDFITLVGQAIMV
jgi:hypothetical protein